MIGTGVMGGLFMILVSIVILGAAVVMKIMKKPGTLYFKLAGFWAAGGIFILISTWLFNRNIS